jgi:hypothetical protein
MAFLSTADLKLPFLIAKVGFADALAETKVNAIAAANRMGIVLKTMEVLMAFPPQRGVVLVLIVDS